MSKKVAVVLFNQGGPGCLDEVKPYLFNMFYDPAILTVSNPFRWMMAKSISKQSAAKVRQLYRQIDDKSPAIEETENQRLKLEAALNKKSNNEFKCFAFMRYSAPFAKDIINNIKEYSPDEIVLLPLFPQYSITMTGSGLIEWNRQAKKVNLEIPFRVIKDFHQDIFFIETIADMINEKLTLLKNNNYRLLICAQSIPKKTIEAGDPYQLQVNKSCEKLVNKVKNNALDHVVCFQNRVGPLEQIGPSIEEEIERAALDKKNIIIVPVSFVSECLETLSELDINYKQIAKEAGIKDYILINTVQDNDKFITGLANLIMEVKI